MGAGGGHLLFAMHRSSSLQQRRVARCRVGTSLMVRQMQRPALQACRRSHHLCPAALPCRASVLTRSCCLRPLNHQGYILDKRIGVGQPKRIENARILVANTPMDTDKIKIYGARVGGGGLV